MKKNPKFESYVLKVVKQYAKVLLLDKHIFDLHAGVENSNALMECRCNYPYLNVTLNYGEKVLEMWKNKEDIRPFVIHELCHPITDPLYVKSINRYASKDEILDEREKLTDYICNIVLKNQYE
jgi:hypothetical protein